MRLLSFILWTQEIISLMDKKKEITFLGKESSTKQVVMTRNIYSCMNPGVCLPTESFYKNLLVILDEVSLRTFGEKTNFPNRFCNLFGLHDDKKILAYLMKLSNNTHSDYGLSYQTVINNQSYAICSGITRPRQFSFGNIPTMSGITDSVGEGWDERKISKFFNKRNNIVNGQEGFP
jgi:hypothetical protein